MRFSYSAVLLAGNALAIAQQECFSQHGADLASFSDCASKDALTSCFSKLEQFDDAAIRSCYTTAGCSDEQAQAETQYTLNRCEELGAQAGGDLKKRYEGAPLPREIPEMGSAPTEPPKVNLLHRRADDVLSGTKCFSTGKKETTECPVETTSGKTTTGKCTDTTVTTSKCAADYICTLDSSNNDICMKKQEMDTAGIIIAICFAVAVALMTGYLTFMCCRDRKEQKRLIAKSEAVALARAATKKQRAAQRQPLIRNASGNSNPGGANPFQDQNRV
ncbi:hypothetical protein ACJ41O_001114 [Fusarium nematophilum]